MDPAPTTLVEAAGRLRWTDATVADSLKAVDTEVSKACGSPLLSSEFVDSVAGLVPRPNDEGGITIIGPSATNWATSGCGYTATYLGTAPPFVGVWSCDQGVVSVDFSSGSVTSLALSRGGRRSRVWIM